MKGEFIGKFYEPEKTDIRLLLPRIDPSEEAVHCLSLNIVKR